MGAGASFGKRDEDTPIAKIVTKPDNSGFVSVIGEYANEKSASFTRPLTSNKKGEERERTCRKLTLLTHNTNTLIATFENNFYNL